MHLRTRLPEIRGARTIKEISAETGIAEVTIRQYEQGKLTPRDKHVEPLERAYGAGIESWYSRRALLALQEGDEAA